MNRIPPDRAFAVDGIVDAEVRAALAEARRLRDAQAAAVEEARQAARAEVHAALAAGLAALAEQRAASERAARQHAKAWALALAERLVGAALRADPATADAWLSALIARAPASDLVVRVPPGTLLDGLPADLDVRVDPALSIGDVILEGPDGVIDARVRTRLARLLAGS